MLAAHVQHDSVHGCKREDGVGDAAVLDKAPELFRAHREHAVELAAADDGVVLINSLEVAVPAEENVVCLTLGASGFNCRHTQEHVINAERNHATLA